MIYLAAILVWCVVVLALSWFHHHARTRAEWPEPTDPKDLLPRPQHRARLGTWLSSSRSVERAK